jgi:hypothetical protein
MTNNILERKNSLEQIFAKKNKELQEIENYKANLINELLMLKGKLDLLNEMSKEEQNEVKTAVKNEKIEKKDEKSKQKVNK